MIIKQISTFMENTTGRLADITALLANAYVKPAIKSYLDRLVVSLGVDTFQDDPISHFLLQSTDYPQIGAKIAALGVPVLFVMEGGYAIEAIGVNAVNVLKGFEAARG